MASKVKDSSKITPLAIMHGHWISPRPCLGETEWKGEKVAFSLVFFSRWKGKDRKSEEKVETFPSFYNRPKSGGMQHALLFFLFLYLKSHRPPLFLPRVAFATQIFFLAIAAAARGHLPPFSSSPYRLSLVIWM